MGFFCSDLCTNSVVFHNRELLFHISEHVEIFFVFQMLFNKAKHSNFFFKTENDLRFFIL